MPAIDTMTSVNDTGGQRALALTAAKNLFLENGYSAFSMRKVARMMNMSQGHLQHYFPTKEDLVTAVLEDFSNEYIIAYDNILCIKGLSGPKKIMSLIDYLVEDSDRPEMVRFFVEFWSLASHNEWASNRLKEMYERNVDEVTRIIGIAMPEVPSGQAHPLAAAMITYIDGLIVQLHSLKPDEDRMAAIKEGAKITLNNMLVEALA